MMEARRVTLPEEAVATRTRRGTINPAANLYVVCALFRKGLGLAESQFLPAAASHISEERFRLLLTVQGWSGDLDGVYYVSGWTDDGLCHLSREEILTRREAIRLQKTGYL